ncbi:MAG: HdeD family acid-resistance protein [Armatimonadota bacterium]
MRNRIWWLTLLRGTLTVILGLLLLVWPDRSAEALIALVGAFALLIGLISTIHASTVRFPLWGASITGGVITLVLGLIALFWPGITATVLIYIIAAWALVFGIIEIIAGLAIGIAAPGGALVAGVGLVSVVVAILLFVVPEAGIVTAAWLLGVYFVASGGLTVYHAVEVRRSRRQIRVG